MPATKASSSPDSMATTRGCIPSRQTYQAPPREGRAERQDRAIDQWVAACKGGPAPLSAFETQSAGDRGLSARMYGAAHAGRAPGVGHGDENCQLGLGEPVCRSAAPGKLGHVESAALPLPPVLDKRFSGPIRLLGTRLRFNTRHALPGPGAMRHSGSEDFRNGDGGWRNRFSTSPNCSASRSMTLRRRDSGVVTPRSFRSFTPSASIAI